MASVARKAGYISMMKNRFGSHLLLNSAAALGVIGVFELLYALFLGDRLEGFWLFRTHAVSVLALMAVAAAAVISYVEFHGVGSQEGVVRAGGTEVTVALTFDDGPHPVYTSRILDILAEKDVTATFFLVGRHVAKYPQVAKRIEQEGHDIGNHTYSHKDLMTASRRTVITEVEKTDQVIREVTGVTTKLFRPPRGAYGPATRKLLVELGYRIVLWTVSAADWSGLPPKAIIARVARYTKPGGIILFHDSGALVRSEGGSRGNTVKALPAVIDTLRDKGYNIVPLSSMLAELEREARLPAGVDDIASAP